MEPEPAQQSTPVPAQLPPALGPGPGAGQSPVNSDVFRSPLFAALHQHQQMQQQPLLPPAQSSSSSSQPQQHHRVSQWTATSLDAHPYEELSSLTSARNSMQSAKSAAPHHPSSRANPNASPHLSTGRSGSQAFKTMSNYSGSGSEASSSALTFPSPASSRAELERKGGGGLAGSASFSSSGRHYDGANTSTETSPTALSFIAGSSPAPPVAALASSSTERLPSGSQFSQQGGLHRGQQGLKASDDESQLPPSKRSSGKSSDLEKVDEVPLSTSNSRSSPTNPAPVDQPGVIRHSASSPSMISSAVAPWIYMSPEPSTSTTQSQRPHMAASQSATDSLRSMGGGVDAATTGKPSFSSWRLRGTHAGTPERKAKKTTFVAAEEDDVIAAAKLGPRVYDDDDDIDDGHGDKDEEDAVFVVSADGHPRTQIAPTQPVESGHTSRTNSPKPRKGFVSGLKKLVQEGASKGSPKKKPTRKSSLTRGLYEQEGTLGAEAGTAEDEEAVTAPSVSNGDDEVHIVSAESNFVNWRPTWSRGTATHDGSMPIPSTNSARALQLATGVAPASRRPSVEPMISPKANGPGADVKASQPRRPNTSTATPAAPGNFGPHSRSGSADVSQTPKSTRRRPSTSSVADSLSQYPPRASSQMMRGTKASNESLSSRFGGSTGHAKQGGAGHSRQSSRASIIEHTSHEDAKRRSGVYSGAVVIGSSGNLARKGGGGRDEAREELNAGGPYASSSQMSFSKSEQHLHAPPPVRPQRTEQDGVGNEQMTTARASVDVAFNTAHDRRWSSTVGPSNERRPRRGSDASLSSFFKGRRGSDTSVRNLHIAKPSDPSTGATFNPSADTGRSPVFPMSYSPKPPSSAKPSTPSTANTDHRAAVEGRSMSPLATLQLPPSDSGGSLGRREKRQSFVGTASQRWSGLFGSLPRKISHSSISRPVSVSSQQGLSSPRFESEQDPPMSPTELVVNKIRRTGQEGSVTPDPITHTPWHSSGGGASEPMQRQSSASRSAGALSPAEHRALSPVSPERDSSQWASRPSVGGDGIRRSSSLANGTEAGVALHQQRTSSKRPTFGLDLQPDAAAAFDCIPSPNFRGRTFSTSSAPGFVTTSFLEQQVGPKDPLGAGKATEMSETRSLSKLDAGNASDAPTMLSSPREELLDLDPNSQDDEGERLPFKTKHRRGIRLADQRRALIDQNEDDDVEEQVKDEDEEQPTKLGANRFSRDDDAPRPRSRHGSADGGSVPPAFGATTKTFSSSTTALDSGSGNRSSVASAVFQYAPPPVPSPRPPLADAPSSPGFDELELLDDDGSGAEISGVAGEEQDPEDALVPSSILPNMQQEERQMKKERLAQSTESQDSSTESALLGLNIVLPSESAQSFGDDRRKEQTVSRPRQNLDHVRSSSSMNISGAKRTLESPQPRRPSTSTSSQGTPGDRRSYTFV